MSTDETVSGPVQRRLDLASGVGSGGAVRPSRVRNRTKTETGEKIKKPAEDSRKKPASNRKTPARGRYVDEYAHPAR